MILSIQFHDGQTHNLIQNNINSKLLELRPQAIPIFQKKQVMDIVSASEVDKTKLVTLVKMFFKKQTVLVITL